MFKRFFLFALVNILIVLTVSVITSVLGLGHYLTAAGIDYGSLAAFCLVWGMVSSVVSLLISKWIAKSMFGIKLVDPNAPGQAGDIARTVHQLAKAAGLSKMPEVGIYNSPEVNAFATGPSRNNSLVAVSEGLIRSMNRQEMEGVLGHEVAHIANGDMVTMTLIQGVVNAFVMFLSRILAYALATVMRGDNDRGPNYLVQNIAIIVFQILFGILGSMVVAWFSRQREFRADRGSAKIGGREKMIAALRVLQTKTELVSEAHQSVAALKISSGDHKSWMQLFSTHPPLSERIAALEQFKAV